MLTFKEKINITFYVLICFSVVLFIIGFAEYMDWLKYLRLFKAGLISNESLKWWRIVDYEPGIKKMIGSIIFGAFISIIFIILRKKKKAGD